MTIAIGLVKDGTVYLGVDGLTTYGWDIKDRLTRKKVFRNGDFLIASAGHTRVGTLLEFAWDPPAPSNPDFDVYTFFVREVVPSIQALMEKHEQPFESSELLVGYQGRLFQIAVDYNVSESERGLVCIGNAHAYAMGAMLATPTLLDPRDRILMAMMIAGECASGVDEPYHIEVLEPIAPMLRVVREA